MSKTKTLKRQRYRPVSEFDEVTLASKREYWRTKKREQRAKQAKKSSKTTNTRLCKPVFTASSFTDKHVSDIPHCKNGSSLLNNNSYQTEVAQNVMNSCHLASEINFKTDINQKETWFEKPKLNRVSCELQDSNTDSKRCTLMCKDEVKTLTNEESNLDAPVVKINGSSFAKGTSAPSSCLKVDTNGTETRQIRKGLSAFNGNLSAISQQSSVPHHTPEFHKQDHQRVKIQSFVTPRSSAFGECKVSKVQDILGRRGANSNRKACEYVPECSTALHKAMASPMTEEEKAAKRRENWRIKKREQRAKRAEKLKKDSERTLCFKKGQQETGMPSHVAPARPLSSVNTMALRGAKTRNSVMSVGLITKERKPVPLIIRMDRNCISAFKQSTHKGVLKASDARASVAKNFTSVPVNSMNHMQNSKQGHTSTISVVSLPSRNAARTVCHSTGQWPRFMQTRRRQCLEQGDGRSETVEEWHAKQREYWRIKKREQRARLSAEVKARLKERDTLKRYAKRYQNLLEQKRKSIVGFSRVLQQNKGKLTNCAVPVSGFIKEDGTVTVHTLKTPSEVLSPDRSCGPAVKSPYLAASTVLQGHMVGSERVRRTPRNIPNNVGCSLNIQQRCSGQNILKQDFLNGSELTSGTGVGKVINDLTKNAQQDRTNFKREAESDSSSSIDPNTVTAPHNTIKQEPGYPTILDTYSLTDQSQGIDIKGIKPSPSPPPETKMEEQPSISDNQATTLLVVASMKRLLEESLTPVTDNSNSFEGVDELMPCKAKDEPFPQLEAEADIKTDLPAQAGEKCDFSGDTKPSLQVKLSPGLCHSPPQAPDFSTEDAVFMHKEPCLQLPCSVTNKSSCFSQDAGDERHDRSMLAVMSPLRRETQGHSGRTTGPQLSCARQAYGGQRLDESSELQRKREYWRVMKRQQRARKAKDKSNDVFHHKPPSQPVERTCASCQAHRPSMANSVSHTDLNHHTLLATATSHPKRLVLSPPVSTNQQPSNVERQLLMQGKAISSGAPQVKKQMQGITPTSSTRPNTVTSTQMNRVKLSGPQTQARGSFITPPKNLETHFKAKEELDAEEAIRRRRMHWRIKKQEQRARKAARERELSHQVTINHVGLNTSTSTTELVQSTPCETLDYLSEQCQTMPFKDDAELYFAPDCQVFDEPLDESKWRSTYLMDYDPINQLLVCMVCGEQQYCLSVEGVRAHIEEAHPGTLTLDERERQGILEAWDEQVAMRERFFTNQLWQNSDALKEQNQKHTAEIEVTLDLDNVK